MKNLGEVDIAILNEIYREAVDLNKKHNWGFQFKVDDGDFETAIEFYSDFHNETGFVVASVSLYHPPLAKDWNDAEDILCPDILDFENKIIFEYEEETGNQRKGARLAKKGHGHPGELANKRDSRRDTLYLKGGFRVLKIWESEYNDGTWKKKMWRFLCDCFCNRIEPKISTPDLKSIYSQ